MKDHLLAARSRVRGSAFLQLAAHDVSSVRYYRRWRATLAGRETPLSLGIPWLTFPSIRWLERQITPRTTAFEWGSGGSTLFLGSRAQSVTSVEHDPDWFAVVRQAVDATGLHGIDYRFIPPAPAAEDAEILYSSSAGQYRGLSFRDYCSAVDSLPDESLDVVLVDGRARVGCVAHARPKLRLGGWLVLDNADASEYGQAAADLGGWERLDFYGPHPLNRRFGLTSAFRRR